MNCDKIKETILQQIEGEEVPEQALVEHLKKCPPCKHYHEEQETIQEMLPAWSAPAPSNDFTEKTLAALRNQPPAADDATVTPRIRRPILWPFAIAAGVLLAVGAAVFRNPTQNVSTWREDIVTARSVGYSQMVDSNRDFNVLGLAYPIRSDFPRGRYKR